MANSETTETYTNSALEFADYFAGIGPRIALIEKGLELAGNPGAAQVVEMGCGDGRDATDIIPRVASYQGVDPSNGLLDLARQRGFPDTKATFVENDALSFAYPEGLDVVYAFATFLHMGKQEFRTACQRVHTALRVGGVLLMTLKERDHYEEEWLQDQFGRRLFFYYPEEVVRELAGSLFSFPYVERETIGSTRWLYIGMRKEG